MGMERTKVTVGSDGAALAGKICLVIGAGRGMGRATAKRFARAGAETIVAARTASELQDLVAEIAGEGGRAIAKSVDITRTGDLESLADYLEGAYGRIDVLVNSAGSSLIAPLEATSEARWDLVLDTNLKGPFLSIRTMLELLRRSESPQVINIASMVGLTGHKHVSAYTASKAGLIGLSRALAQELGPQNIRVTVLCPGPVDTPMRWMATPEMDPSLAISADTVAETIMFLVTLDQKSATNEIVLKSIGYHEGAVLIEG